MSLAAAEVVAEEPRIVHALPGRVRMHLPDWDGRGQRAVEGRLRGLRGVLSAQANALTRNVLVRFDTEETDEETVLAAVQAADLEVTADEEIVAEPEAPPVHREPHGPAGRARIAVRGLDRDPDLARRVVERLERFPTVRASASQLTSRVLVEFDDNQVGLENLLSVVSGVELAELPGEDRPAHPLDREPLVESGVRTA